MTETTKTNDDKEEISPRMRQLLINNMIAHVKAKASILEIDKILEEKTEWLE